MARRPRTRRRTTACATALLSDDGTIRATILARATQTNEAGRMATLVPAFALAADGRPVALLEAGASAGLCLYPDRWGYAWSTPDGVPDRWAGGPTLACAVTGPGAAAGRRCPTVAWRGGIDLNPLDVADPTTTCRGCSTLVWPEHDDRRALLAHAIEVARAEPPRICAAATWWTMVPALVDEARRPSDPTASWSCSTPR